MTAPTKPRGFTEEAIGQLIAARQEPAWMTERRRAAWQAYNEIPMPDSRKDEEWRRTNLRNLKLDATSPLGVAERRAVSPLATAPELAGTLNLIDGAVADATLDPQLAAKGVIVTDLRSALQTHPTLVEQYFMTQAVPARDSKFAALHGAFWDNGVFVYVPKGVVVELPIGVVVEAAAPGRASLSHTLIVLDRDSHLKYVEELRGGDTSSQAFSSRVIEVILHDGATLDLASVQRFNATTWDFYTTRALLGKDTNLKLHTIELGAELSKGRIEAMLQGAGASARLTGVYLGDRKQHYDRFTLQDHSGKATTSDLLFKGVLTDTARSVYSGFIRVHPGAKQSQAYQQNRNILLSRTARADSIPNLEISENDILGCTHGATVGKVDEEQLFYLMCRGLSRAEATQLIVEGFIDELLAEIPLASMQESLRHEITTRVGATAVQSS